jgi:hypothetical protein
LGRMSASKAPQRSSLHKRALQSIGKLGGFSPGIGGGQLRVGFASRPDAAAAPK